MALIKCPECGGQISNTLKQCIHCGCEIKVCPECNNVYLADVLECKECGFKFVEKSEIKKVDTSNDCIKEYNNWKGTSVINEILHSNLTKSILEIITLLFAVFAVITVYNWINGDPIEGVMKYNEVKDKATTLFVIFGIFSVFVELFKKSEILLISNRLNRWSSDNKINFVLSINNYLTSNHIKSMTKERIENQKRVLNNCIDSQIFDDVIFKEKYRNIVIFTILLDVVASILLCVFSINNIEIIMNHYFISFSEKFSFSWIEGLWMFIAFFILGIIGQVADKSRLKFIQNKRNEFLRNNITEGYNNYNKYFI